MTSDSTGIASAPADEWQCPNCTSRHYMRVVLSQGQREFPTQFHTCLGCSAVFIEPALFSAAAKVQQQFPHRPSMAHEWSMERQTIEYRFWESRAKRLSGAIEPKPEMVAAMKSRGRLS